MKHKIVYFKSLRLLWKCKAIWSVFRNFLQEALYQFYILCNKLPKKKIRSFKLHLFYYLPVSVVRMSRHSLTGSPVQGSARCFYRRLSQERNSFHALPGLGKIHFLKTVQFLAADFFKTRNRESFFHLESLPSGKTKTLFYKTHLIR